MIPDSDRPGLDNNTYTNVMTVWVPLRALRSSTCCRRTTAEVVDELGSATKFTAGGTSPADAVFHRDACHPVRGL
jgi:hypothetical protein